MNHIDYSKMGQIFLVLFAYLGGMYLLFHLTMIVLDGCLFYQESNPTFGQDVVKENDSNKLGEECKNKKSVDTEDWPYVIKKNEAGQIPVDLGKRMKYYETICLPQDYVPASNPFVLRLDGRAFSKFTKFFKQVAEEKHSIPYSPEFKRAMILTTHDLVHEFSAVTGYTHSDEITLVFASAYGETDEKKTGTHFFDGRVSKILSTVASYASVRFDFHINNEFEKVYGIVDVLHNSTIVKLVDDNKIRDASSVQMVTSTMNELKTSHQTLLSMKPSLFETPTFDARLIMFPLHKSYEICNLLMWRSKGDCTRNFISMFAEKYLGKKNLDKVNSTERVKRLIDAGVLSFDPEHENVDFSMKHGVFMKRVNKDDPVFGRSTINTTFYVFKTFKYSPEMVKFLTEKSDFADFFELSKSENFTLATPIVYTDPLLCNSNLHDWNKLFFEVPDYFSKKITP